VPSSADIATRRAQVFRDELRGVIDEGHLDPYMFMISELGDEYDLSQVAAAAIKMLLDGNAPAVEDGTQAEEGMERLFIRVGRRDGVGPRDLVGAIANEAGIPGREIGSIDIYENFSFVEVPRQHARTVIDALNGARIRNRRVRADIAVPSEPTPRG
jgi:ATP-dependent RNA helicase DeaD